MAKIREEYQCSLDLTMDLIGGKWKLVILWHLLDGTKRFNELKRMLPDITQKMLTQQLRELEENGLVNRKVYAEVPPKVEYSLTETGRNLSPILEEMCKWATNYAKLNEIILK